MRNIGRIPLEKGIVKHLLPMVEQHGFTLINPTYEGFNHHVSFKHVVNDVIHIVNVVFTKPNFIRYRNGVVISHPEITKLYKQFHPEYPVENWNIFQFFLDSFLHPTNKDRFWNSNESVATYLDKEPIIKEDIPVFAQQLFDVYFKPVIEEVIPETNSLQKIDALINDIPGLMDRSKEVPMLIYSFPLVRQICAGVLLAVHLKRKDAHQLFDRYLFCAEEYAEGRLEEIDTMRKVISFYKDKL